MEVIADGGGMLSVVLVGHPKLRNDLRRPTMEEIGYRSAIFEFVGMANHSNSIWRSPSRRRSASASGPSPARWWRMSSLVTSTTSSRA